MTADPKEIIVGTFPYHDRDDVLRFVVEHIEFQKADGSFVLNKDGKHKKVLRQKRPDPDQPDHWLFNLDGCPALPYKLPQLIEAIAAGHRIILVEGEGKVDLLASWNVPATCNAGGANKWRKEHAEYLRGADVVVLSDADDPGRSHVRVVGTSLKDVAKSVCVLDLPDLGPKEDIRDWAAKGGTVEALHDLIENQSRPFLPKLVLTLADWAARDLPLPDFILGHWLTTTSRVLLTAPTGLGKTMFVMAIGMAMAAALGFLHWRGTRKARVLFIDGEMSRRLLKERLAAETARLGLAPDTFFALSHEDVEGMRPLNTPAGQQFIDSVIRDLGGLDLIIFDNIMALIAGDQKDEEGWRHTMPWVRVLTQRNIGQLWVHHTGHDDTRSYGTKTREWQMDTVLHLEQASRPDTDVSFQLNFRKARERTPATRADFADVRIALVNDQWEGDQTSGSRKGKPRPLSHKFFEVLRDATIGNDANKMFGCPAASLVDWQAECVKRGLLERDKPDSARSMFSKHKLDLIASNWIACNDTMAWVLP